VRAVVGVNPVGDSRRSVKQQAASARITSVLLRHVAPPCRSDPGREPSRWLWRMRLCTPTGRLSQLQSEHASCRQTKYWLIFNQSPSIPRADQLYSSGYISQMPPAGTAHREMRRTECASSSQAWMPGRVPTGPRGVSSVDLCRCVFYTFLSGQVVYAACLTFSGRSGRCQAAPGRPVATPASQ
jgi:hypothetical protein